MRAQFSHRLYDGLIFGLIVAFFMIVPLQIEGLTVYSEGRAIYFPPYVPEAAAR